MYASDMAWRTIPLVVDLHKLGLDIDELGGHRSLGVLRLEVLLVRLGVGHGRPADGAGELEPSGCRLGVVVLAVSLHLFQLGSLLLGFCLGLLRLESASHPDNFFALKKNMNKEHFSLSRLERGKSIFFWKLFKRAVYSKFSLFL